MDIANRQRHTAAARSQHPVGRVGWGGVGDLSENGDGMDEKDRWLTMDQASEYTGLHSATLRRWIKRGVLRGAGVGCVGKGYRFKKFALDRFLELNVDKK